MKTWFASIEPFSFSLVSPGRARSELLILAGPGARFREEGSAASSGAGRLGAVDLAHASRADLLEYAVVPELAAGHGDAVGARVAAASIYGVRFIPGGRPSTRTSGRERRPP